MPRATLTIVVLLAVVSIKDNAVALDPHVDPAIVPASCSACHRGHGKSRSPMLPQAQVSLCLKCHGTQADADRSVMEGALGAGIQPSSLAEALSQPFVHPMDERAFSAFEPGVVTCTSCHSPHRSSTARSSGELATGQRRSGRDPSRLEYELCQQCHGDRGIDTRSTLGISRRLSPNSRSFHPVQAPSPDGSPSVLAGLRGRTISCTDCHGNSDPRGARGPHGSSVPRLLRDPYQALDGHPEAQATYALCYGCHDRERVLDSAVFPQHRSHVVDMRASCATCHDAHGSADNRALIRFGEEVSNVGVGSSIATGRLDFLSETPGTGVCHLSCHGYDHGPAYYGSSAPGLREPSATFPRRRSPAR